MIAIAVAEFAGFLGSLFTTPAISSGWYATLIKPALTPPSWVFGPVWAVLFLLMGIAVFLVWQKGLLRVDVWAALILFWTQLLLNIVWSALFFGLKRPDLAFFEIIVLWVAIAAAAISFFRISRPAGQLMMPYLAWVSFAVYLNYAIWVLN